MSLRTKEVLSISVSLSVTREEADAESVQVRLWVCPIVFAICSVSRVTLLWSRAVQQSTGSQSYARLRRTPGAWSAKVRGTVSVFILDQRRVHLALSTIESAPRSQLKRVSNVKTQQLKTWWAYWNWSCNCLDLSVYDQVTCIDLGTVGNIVYHVSTQDIRLCECQGDLCNQDFRTAGEGGSPTQPPHVGTKVGCVDKTWCDNFYFSVIDAIMKWKEASAMTHI